MRYAKWDVILGMVFSQVIAYFVQVSVAATLFTAGQHDVESAARAAEALRPLAGDAASTLFAIGIIAAGALAVPILTATAAFAVARTVGYRCGLSESWREAKVFYGAIAACALVGAAINFAGFGPMQAAWIASIIFGVLTPPLLVVVLLIANNRRVMGDRTNGGWLNAIGAVALLTNLAAVVGMAATGGG